MVLEIIKPRSASYTFQNNMKYNFMRVIKSQFILLNQSIVQVTWGPYLSATALQNMENAGEWMSLLFISVFLSSFLISKNKPLYIPGFSQFFYNEMKHITPGYKKQWKTRQEQKLQPNLEAPRERLLALESTEWGVKLSEAEPPLVLSFVLILGFKDEEIESQKFEFTQKLMRSNHCLWESLRTKHRNNAQQERIIIFFNVIRSKTASQLQHILKDELSLPEILSQRSSCRGEHILASGHVISIQNYFQRSKEATLQ